MMRRFAAGVLFLLLGACAQIPTAEFGQYQQAFSAVEKSSTDVFVTYDQILARVRLFEATMERAAEGTEAVAPYPTKYEEFRKKFTSLEGHDVEARRQALHVIAGYNAVLLQLVQGKSIDEVQTTAGELAAGLGKFIEAAAGSAVPGFDAAVSLAKTFAGELERARLQREFKQAVENGAPCIDQILQAFIDDAGDMYEANATLAQDERLVIIRAATDQVGALKRLLASVGRPPNDLRSIQKHQQAVNTALVAARGELVPSGYPFTFASATSGPAYTAAVDGEAKLMEAEIERIGGLYQKNIDGVEALGAALVKYHAMLDTTKLALARLRQAVDRPPNLLDVTDHLLDLSFGIERDLADLRTAIAAAK
jgi:hypothetical protein